MHILNINTNTKKDQDLNARKHYPLNPKGAGASSPGPANPFANPPRGIITGSQQQSCSPFGVSKKGFRTVDKPGLKKIRDILSNKLVTVEPKTKSRKVGLTIGLPFSHPLFPVQAKERRSSNLLSPFTSNPLGGITSLGDLGEGVRTEFGYLTNRQSIRKGLERSEREGGFTVGLQGSSLMDSARPSLPSSTNPSGWGVGNAGLGYITRGVAPKLGSVRKGVRQGVLIPQKAIREGDKGLAKPINLKFKTSYSKMTEIKLITVSLASANRIRQWAEKMLPNGKVVGEVINAETLHYKTFKPIKGGLFCERIFGPTKDHTCACGKKFNLKNYLNQEIVLSGKLERIDTLGSNTPCFSNPLLLNPKGLEPDLTSSNLTSYPLTSGLGQKPLATAPTGSEQSSVSHPEGGKGISKAPSKVSTKRAQGDLVHSQTVTDSNNSSVIVNQNIQKRYFCRVCDVEYTYSTIRRTQLGYIQLATPVTHVWYVKGVPNYMSILLDMRKKDLHQIIYNYGTLTFENALKGKQLVTIKPSDLYDAWIKVAKGKLPPSGGKSSNPPKGDGTKRAGIGSYPVGAVARGFSPKPLVGVTGIITSYPQKKQSNKQIKNIDPKEFYLFYKNNKRLYYIKRTSIVPLDRTTIQPRYINSRNLTETGTVLLKRNVNEALSSKKQKVKRSWYGVLKHLLTTNSIKAGLTCEQSPNKLIPASKEGKKVFSAGLGGIRKLVTESHQVNRGTQLERSPGYRHAAQVLYPFFNIFSLWEISSKTLNWPYFFLPKLTIATKFKHSPLFFNKQISLEKRTCSLTSSPLTLICHKTLDKEYIKGFYYIKTKQYVNLKGVKMTKSQHEPGKRKLVSAGFSPKRPTLPEQPLGFQPRRSFTPLLSQVRVKKGLGELGKANSPLPPAGVKSKKGLAGAVCKWHDQATGKKSEEVVPAPTNIILPLYFLYNTKNQVYTKQIQSNIAGKVGKEAGAYPHRGFAKPLAISVSYFLANPPSPKSLFTYPFLPKLYPLYPLRGFRGFSAGEGVSRANPLSGGRGITSLGDLGEGGIRSIKKREPSTNKERMASLLNQSIDKAWKLLYKLGLTQKKKVFPLVRSLDKIKFKTRLLRHLALTNLVNYKIGFYIMMVQKSKKNTSFFASALLHPSIRLNESSLHDPNFYNPFLLTPFYNFLQGDRNVIPQQLVAAPSYPNFIPFTPEGGSSRTLFGLGDLVQGKALAPVRAPGDRNFIPFTSNPLGGTSLGDLVRGNIADKLATLMLLNLNKKYLNRFFAKRFALPLLALPLHNIPFGDKVWVKRAKPLTDRWGGSYLVIPIGDSQSPLPKVSKDNDQVHVVMGKQQQLNITNPPRGVRAMFTIQKNLTLRGNNLKKFVVALSLTLFNIRAKDKLKLYQYTTRLIKKVQIAESINKDFKHLILISVKHPCLNSAHATLFPLEEKRPFLKYAFLLLLLLKSKTNIKNYLKYKHQSTPSFFESVYLEKIPKGKTVLNFAKQYSKKFTVDPLPIKRREIPSYETSKETSMVPILQTQSGCAIPDNHFINMLVNRLIKQFVKTHPTSNLFSTPKPCRAAYSQLLMVRPGADNKRKLVKQVRMRSLTNRRWVTCFLQVASLYTHNKGDNLTQQVKGPVIHPLSGLGVPLVYRNAAATKLLPVRSTNKTVNLKIAQIFKNNIFSWLSNNIYCLSHRYVWEEDQEKNWRRFTLYFYPPKSSTATSIPLYKNRNYNELFNFDQMENVLSDSRFAQLSPLNPFSNPPQGDSFDYSSISLTQDQNLTQSPDTFNQDDTLVLTHREINRHLSYITSTTKGMNIHTTFSGPGIIQKLLNEFNFTELKKMDKQNRILLFEYNKHVKKLKKVMDPRSLKSRLEYYKACHTRDVSIRRTKLIRKIFSKATPAGVPLLNFGGQTQSTTYLLSPYGDSQSPLTEGLNMILTVLPVLPPDLRPIVKTDGKQATADLNTFYKNIIYRNERLKKFLKDPALNSSFEMKYAQRLVQEAVDNLIQNGKGGVAPIKDARGRLLKSLSDGLKGKQGRFRQYLLGKRVDYSARSVIVVGPRLKLHECGIPKEIALALYFPFLIKRILNQKLALTVPGAKGLIQKKSPLVWQLLREIMKTCPVILNRAPTLHRLGFQAFQPKLVEGKAILLHPLVCPAFNADFDGDQMAVHVPITYEAKAEAWKLMLSRNNLLSPATGEPILLPSQDMVLGCYYLTTNCAEKITKYKRGTGFYFHNINEVLKAYNQQLIDLHALIWVNMTELNFNSPIQDQPLEIRIPTIKYKIDTSSLLGLEGLTGQTHFLIKNNRSLIIYIYSKLHQFIDFNGILSSQIVRTTPGRILFNNMVQTALNKRPKLLNNK